MLFLSSIFTCKEGRDRDFATRSWDFATCGVSRPYHASHLLVETRLQHHCRSWSRWRSRTIMDTRRKHGRAERHVAENALARKSASREDPDLRLRCVHLEPGTADEPEYPRPCGDPGCKSCSIQKRNRCTWTNPRHPQASLTF